MRVVIQYTWNANSFQLKSERKPMVVQYYYILGLGLPDYTSSDRALPHYLVFYEGRPVGRISGRILLHT